VVLVRLWVDWNVIASGRCLCSEACGGVTGCRKFGVSCDSGLEMCVAAREGVRGERHL